MCGVNQTKQNDNDNQDLIRRSQKANNVGNLMNKYKNFGRDAVGTPVNLLEIYQNKKNYNKRLDAILKGEDDPAGY